MTAQPLIQAVDVSLEYARNGSGGNALFNRGPPAPTVQAVKNVSLDIERGEYVGITGPSGAGKSTLLHMLGALETPTSGAVYFEGEDIGALSKGGRTKLRLDHIGVVFQRFHLLDSLTARQNVALPLLEQGVPKRTRQQRAETILNSVGLGDRLDHRPAHLSGGEQQRVAIARALVTEPALVIADEPTGELDSEATAAILDILTSAVGNDRAVIVASHDEAAIEPADRTIRLRDGRLQAIDGHP